MESLEAEKEITDDTMKFFKNHTSKPFDKVITGVISYYIAINKVELSNQQFDRIFDKIAQMFSKSA